MRRHTTLLSTLAALLILSSSLPALAEVLTADGEHDIEVLLAEAKKAFDLSGQDAVYLLDSTQETWTDDGRLRHTVHQVVYIRTAMGIRRHADLRVPYDSERQTLALSTLRTWRPSDRRWIESGETARVETLPFALRSTPDYAGRREAMLLHDGVELPCVLETVYTIEDTAPFRAGLEGEWAPARRDPVLHAHLDLQFERGTEGRWLHAGDPAAIAHDEPSPPGSGTHGFHASRVEPLPDPETPETSAALPRVLWSSWSSWSALGEDLVSRLDAAASPDDALRARLEETLEKARSPGERARLVAGLVEESTSEVHHEIGWWPEPRPAARTWATAYGGAVDRTVLAAALFRAAGFEARLAFRAAGLGEPDTSIPTLGWSEGPALWVSGEGLEAYFDPHGSRLSDWRGAVANRDFWRPGIDEKPARLAPAGETASRFALCLDLGYDAEAQAWKGSGVLTATAAFSPFSRMSGLEVEALAYLEDLLSSILDGAEVDGYNPEVFSPSSVTVGFALGLPAGERDGRGRLHLSLGDEALSPFLEHAGAGLYREVRGSAVHLPGRLEQRIELRLRPGDLEEVHLPADVRLENEAGSFLLTSTVKEKKEGEESGEIVIVRELSLSSAEYAPEAWPELRALLLADAYERSRLLLLK